MDWIFMYNLEEIQSLKGCLVLESSYIFCTTAGSCLYLRSYWFSGNIHLGIINALPNQLLYTHGPRVHRRRHR
jgi:hypothetical protein